MAQTARQMPPNETPAIPAIDVTISRTESARSPEFTENRPISRSRSPPRHGTGPRARWARRSARPGPRWCSRLHRSAVPAAPPMPKSSLCSVPSPDSHSVIHLICYRRYNRDTHRATLSAGGIHLESSACHEYHRSPQDRLAGPWARGSSQPWRVWRAPSRRATCGRGQQ